METPPIDIPNWIYYFEAAMGSTFNSITDLVVAAIPIALPVAAAYFAIRRVWRASKGLTR